MNNTLLLSLALLIGLSIGPNTHAAANTSIPPTLEPWVDWVLHEHPEFSCPHFFNSPERYCLWPGTLSIKVDRAGAEFAQTLTLYRETYFPLPGNHEHWPQNLQANGKPLLVLAEGDGTPVGFLPAGDHTIKGEIRWQQMPRTLAISEYTGRIELTLNETPVSQVRVEDRRQLVLGEAGPLAEEKPQNSLSLRVFRLLSDAIPQQLTTELQLDVSGSEREALLGQLLPGGFVPWQFDSPLPARLESDGQVRVQLKPGRWQIRLQSYSLAPPETLGFAKTTEHWPDSEIWAFQAHSDYRTVQLEGAPGIDPAQTSLPSEWRRFPAYLLTPETPLTLIEQHRAPSHFGEHELHLSKTLWLDFDGAGFTVRDQINGQLKGHARLETLEPYALGSATSNNTPLLVTRLEDRETAGIEVRDQHAQITALSRLPRHYSLPVSGWQANFSSVDASLHLPPGWSLLAASGVDRVSGAWLDNWNLWDIFLVLVISVAIARAGSWPLGLLSLVTLILLYQRPGAPVFLWLNLAACLALAQVVTERWQKHLRTYTLASFALLALVYLPFATQQARLGIYPQLEHSGIYASSHKAVRSRGLTQAPQESAQPAHGDMMLEEVVVTGIRESLSRFEPDAGFSEPAAPAPAPAKITSLAPTYGPNQLIQAGPAEQHWHWNLASLGWSGPVRADQQASLLLVPPAINRLGYLLAVLIPLALALLLWRKLSLPAPRLPRTSGASASVLVLACTLPWLPTGQPEASVFIDNDLLEELEHRLTRESDCLPACASIESITLQADGDQLNIALRIHAQASIALPLPVERHQWQPRHVRLNGVSAPLARSEQGQLLIALPQGRHQITLQGTVQGLQQLNLPFGLPIHNLSSAVQGWQLSGAPRGRSLSRDLRLERIASTDAAVQTSLQPTEMPPFVYIQRNLHLGQEWTLDTHIQRRAPARGSISIDVPLLPGESPLSGDATDEGTMRVSLSPDQSSFTWSSVLTPVNQLTLKAAGSDSPWIERWQVQATPVWHLQTEGEASLAGSGLSPEWHPRPGDQLTLKVSRPEAVSGEILTVTRADLVQQSGLRSSSVKLRLGVKTYQGGHFDFTLPEQAELTELTIDNRPQPLIKTRGELRIPVTPGEQSIELNWQTPESTGLLTRTPALDLQHQSGNIQLVLQLPQNRWTLLTGGPLLGPAVQIWGVLLVVLLVAFGLGRSGLTPLKTWEWVLLGLGVVTLNSFLLAVAAAWFIALTLRGQHQPTAHKYFNLTQILLVALTLITLFLLISAIPYGLLAQPAMLVTGNGSSAHYLNWYLDQSDGALPQGWVLSLPLWVYRLVMLLWSLWLALALTRWLPWAWRQLGTNGWWKKPAKITTDTQPE